jgi:hypothetical protein
MPKVIQEIWGSCVKLSTMDRFLSREAMIREMESAMQHELGPKSFGRDMDEAIGFSCKGEDRKRKSGCETEFDSLGVGGLEVSAWGLPGMRIGRCSPGSIGGNRRVRLPWRSLFDAWKVRLLRVARCNKSPTHEQRCS